MSKIVTGKVLTLERGSVRGNRILRYPLSQTDEQRDQWVEQLCDRIDRDIEELLVEGIPLGWDR